MPDWQKVLLDAHRKEFLTECRERGMADEHGEECLITFEREVLDDHGIEAGALTTPQPSGGGDPDGSAVGRVVGDDQP